MPVRAPLRPSEVSDPLVTIDTSKKILALDEGSKKINNRVEDASVCRCESGLNDSGVGNTILNNQVLQHITDLVVTG